MAQETFTVTADVKSPADRKNIEAGLKAYAALEFEDRDRIYQIISNSKALKALKTYWLILKTKI